MAGNASRGGDAWLAKLPLAETRGQPEEWMGGELADRLGQVSGSRWFGGSAVDLPSVESPTNGGASVQVLFVGTGDLRSGRDLDSSPSDKKFGPDAGGRS